MNNDFSVFDSFIASPDQRPLTTVLCTLLAHSSGTNNVVVFGDKGAVAELVTTIAYHFPQEKIQIGLVAQQGTTITIGPPFLEPLTPLHTKAADGQLLSPFISGGQITNAIRQVLHSNPDILAITDIDNESKELLLMEASTGRQIVVGLEADTVDQALVQMMDDRPIPAEQKISFRVGIAVEVRTVSNGAVRIVRVCREHDGVLQGVAAVDQVGNVLVDASLLPVVQ